MEDYLLAKLLDGGSNLHSFIDIPDYTSFS